MRDVFVPVAVALLLAFLLAPVTDALRKLRLGRIVAALITLILAFTVLGLLTTVVVRELMNVSSSVPIYGQRIHERVQEMSRMPAVGSLARVMATVTHGFSNASPNEAEQTDQAGNKPILRAAKQPVPVVIVSRGGSGFSLTRSFLAPLLGPLGQAGIVLLFTTFILLNKEDVRNRFVRLAGLGRMSVTTLALDDAGDRVGRYLRFALLINVSFGSVIALGLLLIGLPNVVLWGILAGLMRFVPYVGILISGSAPLLLSLAIFTGWVKPGLVLLLFLALEAIVANAIEPIVYGVKTGTSPLGLLVAAIFWTVLWGPAGLVISTPLTVCLVVLGRYVPALSFLHVLLAEEPALTEEERLYQRLLATDREESQSIIDKAFEEKQSLLDLYDGLLIPAVRLAEQDRHKGAVQRERADYIFSTLNEIIIEVENNLEAEEGSAKSPAAKTGRDPVEFKPAADCPQQVACMGVVDEADELCARMLAQVLHRYGCNCVHFPSDWIHELREDTDDIIFLSAVPPFAFVSARSYCARIRRQCPSSTIIVGMWGYPNDPERIKERFGTAKPDYVITRLSEALEFVVGALPDRPTNSKSRN